MKFYNIKDLKPGDTVETTVHVWLAPSGVISVHDHTYGEGMVAYGWKLIETAELRFAIPEGFVPEFPPATATATQPSEDSL